jgi:peptide/nickel transport system ATP-binding protein
MTGPGTAHLRDDIDALLRVENLVVEFPVGGRRKVHAVSDVSLDLGRAETLALVGESGCGKSTIGRAIVQLPRPTSGSVNFGGHDLAQLDRSHMRSERRRIQIILQDPKSSLNPRRKVRDAIAEGVDTWGLSRDKLEESMRFVGLDPVVMGERRPHQLSGGQSQRVCIARALMLDPQVLICDEPVSALDVSVQAQILNLLEDMKVRYGLSMIFITHDLAVVKMIADRVMVMYLGKLCEVTTTARLYERPAHPYTNLLLESVPEPTPGRAIPSTEVAGDLPSPIDPPSGCRFRTRCPRAEAKCAAVEPEVRELEPGHFVACHFPIEADSTTADTASERVAV